MSKVGPKSGESDLGMQPISTFTALIATRSAVIWAKTRAMVQSCHSGVICLFDMPPSFCAAVLRWYGAKRLGKALAGQGGCAMHNAQILGDGAVRNGFAKTTLMGALCLGLASCGQGGLFGGAAAGGTDASAAPAPAPVAEQRRSTIWDLFSNADNPNKTVAVNRYIWNASLDVLNFLPIESVDPFTGVIVTGYGTPPNGGRAYRATILVQDPALDARSLKLSLQTRGGAAVAPATLRAVEDAILSRARQLRIADSKL